ncbi:hypothetical protein [Dysgonomonas capnocytophagoides]|uniref:hypothetical protein n=1 Tax=Dysgonomonas capnocytophagoides TaxID=45254 RepID=UPI002A82A2CD|nr:hypothetical protein [Dysgonomonas capnocytophagoides]
MDTPITRAEHDEFCKRMEEAHRRQDKRISLLEESVEQNRTLAVSVEKLAVNMENMLKEQEQQSKRLEVIENRDGEMWRKITGYVVTAVIGIILGFIFNYIGL